MFTPQPTQYRSGCGPRYRTHSMQCRACAARPSITRPHFAHGHGARLAMATARAARFRRARAARAHGAQRMAFARRRVARPHSIQRPFTGAVARRYAMLASMMRRARPFNPARFDGTLGENKPAPGESARSARKSLIPARTNFYVPPRSATREPAPAFP